MTVDEALEQAAIATRIGKAIGYSAADLALEVLAAECRRLEDMILSESVKDLDVSTLPLTWDVFPPGDRPGSMA